MEEEEFQWPPVDCATDMLVVQKGWTHMSGMYGITSWMDAYWEKKLVGHDTANAHAVINEPEVYV